MDLVALAPHVVQQQIENSHRHGSDHFARAEGCRVALKSGCAQRNSSKYFGRFLPENKNPLNILTNFS